MIRDPVRRFASQGRIRFLGGDAVLFDPVTWSTHVLNEGAALIARRLTERDRSEPPTFEAALEIACSELGWDRDDPATRQTLDGFVDAELVQPPVPD